MNLTKSEEQLMELFWNNEGSLTSVDIVNMKFKPTWSSGLVQNMIRSLIKKNALQLCGTKQYGTQYARELAPAITREEYAAQLILNAGFSQLSISKVIAALAEDAGSKDDVIEQLEAIIKQLKEE
ncbi:MAG: BlaI/MecI/CopY family transcriptional regulator [Lachnospiraceae bacterium]|nr:BlaI/MecI/CopY family transcriptional regulator [Lachnospiraceae bacterium]